ncbi:MAG: glycine/betaine ABC transporter substrate-binding protein [Propionibacteriales bacterium]|nr:glycine/betaine ABC transporter substrate-binding protein [Propionibacteriales bacterium]
MSYRTPARLAGLALAAGLLAACGGGDGGGGGDPLSDGGGETCQASSGDGVVIGSANFSENVLLAEIYAGALEAAGVTVEKKLNIGSRETLIPALKDGSIDLVPEYTGNLLTYLDEEADEAESDAVYEALGDAVPDGCQVLEQSPAEDKDALVVTKESADSQSLATIPDLQPVAGDLIAGGSSEFETRRAGLVGLKEVYDIEFGEFKTLDPGGPLSVEGLLKGDVDVVNLFTTNPVIETEGLVVLEDPESLFSAQNVVPLITEEKATDEVTEALNGVSAALDTEQLIALMKRVDVDKENPADVAAAWLTEAGLV